MKTWPHSSPTTTGWLPRPRPPANLLGALIYLNSGGPDGFTVPLGISFAMTKYSPTAGGQGDYQYVMVAALLVTVPLLVLFAVGQRYFVEGVATQGRKG